MKSSTGRWVSGNEFFDREADLAILSHYIQDHNHVLLTGQRRMGKTSVARELSRQLETKGWITLFCDVEAAICAEDVIADIAKAAQVVRPIAKRIVDRMKRIFGETVDEVGAYGFRLKVRAGLNAGNWRRHGELLLRDCAEQDERVLLVIDELPVFLMRLLSREHGPQRVDEFLSWLRGVFQDLGQDAPVLIISGSIGLEPLVRRLHIPDRINYLYSYRLQPWDRATSVKCFESLAKGNGLHIEDGVPEAVHDALGIGIPHHVQSFFARLRDFAVINQRDRVTVDDVEVVYRTELLGPSGQIDLSHYDSRLREALPEERYAVAVRILAEAAIQEVFTLEAQLTLERECALIMKDARESISEVLDVLVHDGYLVRGDDGYRFSFRLLKEWWETRFRGHYMPLDKHVDGNKPREAAQ